MEHCPACRTDLDGGPIPEEIRQHYSPPYRWKRTIFIVDADKDEVVAYRCPDCRHQWSATPCP